MQGSLQIKNGKFHMVLSYKDNAGKHKTKWITTGFSEKGNRRKAEQLLRNTIVEYEEKHVEVTKAILFTDFMREWLEIIRTQVKYNTYNQYRLVVSNSIIPYFETKRQKVTLQDLTPLHIQGYYNKKLKDGVSGNTVKRHHANIHKALTYAVKSNLIPYNPADRVELPKIEKFTGKYYTEEQIKQLFNLVMGTVLETPVILAATYGLRRSEVLGLKWDAIDFDRDTITIQHTVTGSGKNTVAANTTKNKSSHRTLPLLLSVKKYLLELQRQQKSMQLLMGKSYIKNDYICKRIDGDPIKPDYVTCSFRKMLKKNNLEKIRFHDLRHSSASLLINKGYGLKEIQEWLGHADIQTTNRYSHLMYESKVDMGNTVEGLLFPA